MFVADMRVPVTNHCSHVLFVPNLTDFFFLLKNDKFCNKNKENDNGHTKFVHYKNLNSNG